MASYSAEENDRFLADQAARERTLAPLIAGHRERLQKDPRYWQPEPGLPELEVPSA